MEIPGELLKQTSIIVCTVDRLTDLEECLKSLRPFRAAVAEIIVVNNGPHLAAVEEIAQRHGARVVTEPQRGVSRARNAGIRAATGNILAFLDDDSVADPNWLPLLLAPFPRPPSARGRGKHLRPNPRRPGQPSLRLSPPRSVPGIATDRGWKHREELFPHALGLGGQRQHGDSA